MTTARTNIEAFRQRHGLLQGEFSALVTERTGEPLHRTTVCRYETGARKPRVKKAQAIAQVLGVPTHLVTAAPRESA